MVRITAQWRTATLGGAILCLAFAPIAAYPAERPSPRELRTRTAVQVGSTDFGFEAPAPGLEVGYLRRPTVRRPAARAHAASQHASPAAEFDRS
jgi:hypothetical protein